MEKADLFSLSVISYDEVRRLGHKTQAGIYKPRKSKHAFSIITNVGEYYQNYEDKIGDDLVLIYHGRGKKRDQTLDDFDNYALFMNYKDQVAVRVFAGGDNHYRDWGYWQIIECGTEYGLDRYLKLIYKLVPVKINEEKEPITLVEPEKVRYANYVEIQVKQQIRYAPELKKLKEFYNYTCQVGHEVPGLDGGIVEVHHLKKVSLGGALVTPNNSNELVLCPNCHALFDNGTIYIDDYDGKTLHHRNGHPAYEGQKLYFVDGHVLDRLILKSLLYLKWV